MPNPLYGSAIRAAIKASSAALDAAALAWGPDHKVTLLVRLPGCTNQEYILTSEDDLGEVRALVERRMLALAPRGTPQ